VIILRGFYRKSRGAAYHIHPLPTPQLEDQHTNLVNVRVPDALSMENVHGRLLHIFRNGLRADGRLFPSFVVMGVMPGYVVYSSLLTIPHSLSAKGNITWRSHNQADALATLELLSVVLGGDVTKVCNGDVTTFLTKFTMRYWLAESKITCREYFHIFGFMWFIRPTNAKQYIGINCFCILQHVYAFTAIKRRTYTCTYL
jgi:hypothetical protein